MKRLAIIGLGNGMNAAPMTDERWGLPWSGDSSYDVYFEMHDKTVRPFTEEYCNKLTELDVPIIMQEIMPTVPNSVEFPKEILLEVGNYIESSVGYMLAASVFFQSRFDAVDLYGIGSPFDSHYVYQRANLEYLIGFARGTGMVVTIQEESELLSSYWEAKIYGFDQENLRPGTEYVH